MGFGLVGPLVHELLFFRFIVEGATNRVDIFTFPVGFMRFSLHDFVVCGDLGIVVLDVLIGDRVVLARHVHTLIAVLLALK